MEESWGLQDYSDGAAVASVDPVCGKKVNEADAPGGHATYAGQKYYFCSGFCRKNFEQDPGKFIGQTEQP